MSGEDLLKAEEGTVMVSRPATSTILEILISSKLMPVCWFMEEKQVSRLPELTTSLSLSLIGLREDSGAGMQVQACHLVLLISMKPTISSSDL